MIAEDLQKIERPNRLKERHKFRASLVLISLIAACVITIPPAKADIRVTVQAGDSLSLIALEYGVSTQSIMNANGITNPDLPGICIILGNGTYNGTYTVSFFFLGSA